jgi:hypothetical protein
LCYTVIHGWVTPILGSFGCFYLNLTFTQVRSAVSYYATYKAEIDEWIRRNDEEAETAEAVWRREQAALA